MSTPNSTANNKENISENQISARRYACPHYPKTFSTPMVMGGHQNAQRQRPEKRPMFTSQGVSGPSSSPALGVESMATRPSLVGPVRESPSPFSRNCLLLQEYFTRTRREEYLRSVRSSLSAPLALPTATVPLAPSPPPAPLAPRAQPRSTMFFGVPDFFQPSVAPTTPSGDVASSAGLVATEEKEKEEEEEEEMDLNLDLKL